MFMSFIIESLILTGSIVGWILFGVFLYIRVSQGRYMTGKPIPEEKIKETKYTYLLWFFGLPIFLGFMLYDDFMTPPSPKQVAQESTRIQWDVNNPEDSPATLIQNTIDIFSANNYGMQNYPGAIDSAILEIHYPVQGLTNYRQEELGWTTEVYIQIKIANNANIPSEWQAEGHTLHYWLGGGANPGIVAQKIQSHLFLGAEPNPDRDIFFPVADLVVVDQL